MNIGFDIDDVLFDFVGSFLSNFNKENDTNVKVEDISTWNICGSLGINYDEFKRKIEKYEIYTIPINNDIKKLFKKLKKKGHKIYLITKRIDYFNMYTDTMKGLDGLVRDKIIFCNNYLTKGVVCNDLKIDLFIDDCIENLLDIKKKSPRTKILLHKRPWNQEEERNRIGCFDNMKETDDIIKYFSTI